MSETTPERMEIEATLAELIGCRQPLLIGVRHHSPACAAAVPALLEAHDVRHLLIELPADLQPWLAWLAHEELRTPVALGVASAHGERLGFYPFADFSPELAAIRWAFRMGVEVCAFDLPAALRADESQSEPFLPSERPSPASWAQIEETGAESIWDGWVEARAPGATAEQVRAAGLAVGWALRRDAAGRTGIETEDLQRETYMRRCLRELEARSQGRIAVVVGAFHAPALLPEPRWFEAREALRQPREVVTSLIPYNTALLDSRSGYPAGIRDPLFQQASFEALSNQQPHDELVARFVVDVCRHLRMAGHVASVPDATESVRMANALASMRGLPAPGRTELLEGLQSCVTRGEPLGRGRAVARALEAVMVGERRGAIPGAAPRSGLAPHVEAILERLDLPRPGASSAKEREVRLDPLRNRQDRRRQALLQRLTVCGVPYGRYIDAEGPAAHTGLTQRWVLLWTPSCEALLERAGVHGVTLQAACRGLLTQRQRRLKAEGTLDASAWLQLLEEGTRAGLGEFVRDALAALETEFVPIAGLKELARARRHLHALSLGHFAALPVSADDAVPGEIEALGPIAPGALSALTHASIDALEGVTGSADLEDARALQQLCRDLSEDDARPRLVAGVTRLMREGAPLVEGAASACAVILGLEDAAQVGLRLGSWIDQASTSDARDKLTRRLSGLLCGAASLFEAHPELSADLLHRVAALNDKAFLERVVAMRAGFSVLSPAARARLLATWGEMLGDRIQLDAAELLSPELAAALATADAHGRQVALPWAPKVGAHAALRQPAPRPAHVPTLADGSQLTLHDRARLLLGQDSSSLHGRAQLVGMQLDALYGRGQGEGAGQGGGAGLGAATPSVREWVGEIEGLFGESVREEVVGRIAELGYAAALESLDPDKAPASVDLLERVLALKGALPESKLEHLRRIVARIVEQLVEQLARRLRPALVGIPSPRASTRRTDTLDLPRTIRRNLAHVRRRSDGSPLLIPERLYFKVRNQRELDWRIVLVVDVSGSMSPSVIYSAMVAAILAQTPWVSTHFLAFNTSVMDLSHRVSDPLALLLEVDIGGGTDIGGALAAARKLIRVPSRTIVALVTDFDEGGSVGRLLAQVDELHRAGVHALGLAALDDAGKPRFNRAIAQNVVAAGMPVAALTPLELVRWISERLR